MAHTDREERRRTGLLISDDAGAFKQVAEGLALDHQVCKSQVLRNTKALIETLTVAVAPDSDGSLAALGVSGPQAVADLQRLDTLICARQPEQVSELELLFYRYAQPNTPVWPIVCARSSWAAGTSGRA